MLSVLAGALALALTAYAGPMTTPGNSGNQGGGGRPNVNVVAAVDEADDGAYYYFVDWVEFESRGETAYRIALFPENGLEHNLVDLRDPGSTTGVAFVRSPLHPSTIVQQLGTQELPPEVFYVGQSIGSNLSVRQRNEARTRLALRGQVTTIKSILRFMLLTEATEAGKPGRLMPEPDGGLYVYLGDLRVDLTNG